jgi:uncharacterized membrane protein (DUF4010 family)
VTGTAGLLAGEVGTAVAPLAAQAALLEEPLVRIAVATALGMFLGLEREWSQKSAGIRTYALISMLAAVFSLLAVEMLLAVGAVLIIAQGVLLAVQGLLDEDVEGLSLTTSVSMLVAYGVGALVAGGQILAGVTVAVLSSLLLVLKRELHSFAWGLSREEVRSASEFAILAFVVLPLLPARETLTLGGLSVQLEPRVVWLMVVTVAGIGVVNYAVVATYGGRGIAVTGFFGGLASSTAVVGAMLDRVARRPELASYAVAAILLADAAMALRNLVIAVAFTLGADTRVLVSAVVPLGIVIVGSVAIAFVTADWGESVDLELESPFSMRNALLFGAVFLVIVLAGGFAQAGFGSTGLYVAAALGGLVSSASATTSAVVLYRDGAIAEGTAIVTILVATAASIAVKAALAATAPDRSFARRVAFWSTVLLAGAAVPTVIGLA